MTDALPALTSFGRALVQFALTMNFYCAALLGLALLADRLLASRVGPGWRIALYLAVFARLAVPVGYESPLRGWLNPSAVTIAPSLTNHAEVQIVSTGTVAIGPGSASAASASGHAPDPLGLGATVVYLIVVIAGVSVWALRAARLRRAVRDCPTARAEWAGMLPGIHAVEHPSFGPLVAGLFRPTVVLNAAALNGLRTDEVRRILRHEAAHLQRGDHFLAPLLFLAALAAWPVVPVWVALARVRALMEQACDAVALEGADRAARAQYGRVLLDLAAPLPHGPGLVPTGAPAFSTGVRGRLRALALPRPTRPILQAALVLPLCGILLACAGKAPPAKSSAGPAPQTLSEVGPAPAPSEALALTFRIIDGWPNHPRLERQMKDAPAAGKGDPAAPGTALTLLANRMRIEQPPTAEEAEEAHTLTPGELDGLLGREGMRVLSAPMLKVLPGQPASIRVGEDGPDGSPISGFKISTVAVPGPGGTYVGYDFIEYGARSRMRAARAERRFIPEGHTACIPINGAPGRNPGTLLITAERATPTGETTPEIPLPRIMYMVNHFECTRLLDAEGLLGKTEVVVLGMGDAGKGGKVVANPGVMPENAQVETGWARLFRAANAETVFDRIRMQGEVRLVSAPALIVAPKEWASIRATETDKARQPMGLELRLMGTPSADGAHLTIEFRAARADGRALASGTVRVLKDHALLLSVPPEEGEQNHRLIMVRPSFIRTIEEYPFQTAGPLAPPPPPPSPPPAKAASPQRAR